MAPTLIAVGRFGASGISAEYRALMEDSAG
jgi:hypothetical protein